MDTSANSAIDPAAATAIESAHVPVRLNRESSSASTLKGDTSSPASRAATKASTSRSSPLASRETSPGRPPLRSGAPRAASTAGSTRSRKSSSQETSPQRTSKPTASSAAASGKITSSTTPNLGPVNTDASARLTAPQRSPVTAEHLKEGPRWPLSPRLRSPPPTAMLNRPSLPPPRKAEPEPPSIQVLRSSPPSLPQQPDASNSDYDGDEVHLQPGMRTPARGASGSNSATTLETVEEVSPLASPHEVEGVSEKMDDLTASEAGSQADHLEFSVHSAERSQAPSTKNDSGSESGSVKDDRKGASASVPPPLTSRQSSTSTRKAKPSEGSVQHMTVETETVTSIPQHSLAPVAVKEGINGPLRTRPSSETIRPKKEKKKSNRKQPNIGPGTASSKADIFEAKIASAVDEADSSDSEETFVYDSNPPDNNDRPRRFHSRTPSATSMVSQVDRNGLRSISSIMDNAGSSAGTKRNMKFVSTFNSSGNESAMVEDDGKGTARSAAGSARGAGRVHHHHLGRWGRNGANGHTSLFDTEAPFHISNMTAQRSKFSTNSNSSRQPSGGPPSPRFLNAGRMSATGKRGVHSASYDLDDTTGTRADDERTPLLHGSVRSSRSGRPRRSQPVSLRSLEGQTYRRNPSVLNRFASCLVLTVMLLLVVSGAIGFMFATSQPLTDVELIAIKSVVAAEQELIFDIEVKAHNPNVVVVSIDQADIEVFAKSPHAGTDSGWWHQPDHQGSDSKWDSHHGGVDTGEDSDGPVDEKAPNMRLGTIGRLDSALSFEGSFFNHGVSDSTGEVRLRAPGNGTTGGTERWERILQEEFDLIVKGVLKYSLPLSQHVRSATISGRTTIKPNAANDPTRNRTEPVTRPKKPE